MGFSFKVAPGIRVRATSHGVRTSLGPRAARVHVGAGRTGFPSGIGPVSLYTSSGGGRRRSRSAVPSKTSVAAHERQLRQTQKSQQAAELTAVFDAIEGLHRQEVTPAVAPVAPASAPVDEAAIRRWHEQQALQGLNVLQWQARRIARKRAAEAAQRDINTAISRGLWEQGQIQHQLNGQWHRLLANDPEVVLATLTEAFEGHQALVAVTGVENGEASVLVMAPGIDAVPERMPTRTAAGNLSIAKITKTQRNSFYLSLICGHVLMTGREALAIAPGLQAVRVAVIRQLPPDAYGTRMTECLLAAVFTRHRLAGIQWHSANAIQVVKGTSADLRIRLSGTSEPLALNLAEEPALAALLQVIDIGEDEPSASANGPGGHPTLPVSAGAAPTATLPGPRPLRSGGGTRRATSRSTKVTLVAFGALVMLLVIVAASHGIKPVPTGNASVVAASTPTHKASASPTPHAKKSEEEKKAEQKQAEQKKAEQKKAEQKKAEPKQTYTRARATTPPPVTAPAVTAPATTPAAAPSTPAATSPTGCYPLSDEGTCYEPGEYCRDSDHGASGVAGDGETITCEDNDGWRWEPS
jgi:outer membrane biosynthesis protein TonB